MSEHDILWQERRLEEILFSGADPVSKVRQITRLGFDPEVADEILERHQLGLQSPVYYERLDFADFDDDEQELEAEVAEDEAQTKADYGPAA